MRPVDRALVRQLARLIIRVEELDERSRHVKEAGMKHGVSFRLELENEIRRIWPGRKS